MLNRSIDGEQAFTFESLSLLIVRAYLKLKRPRTDSVSDVFKEVYGWFPGNGQWSRGFYEGYMGYRPAMPIANQSYNKGFDYGEAVRREVDKHLDLHEREAQYLRDTGFEKKKHG